MTFSSHSSSLIVRFLGFSHLLIALGSGACVIVALKVLGIEEGFEPSALIIYTFTWLGYSVTFYYKQHRAHQTREAIVIGPGGA